MGWTMEAMHSVMDALAVSAELRCLAVHKLRRVAD